MSAAFTLTLNNSTEVSATRIYEFFQQSARAVELFQNRDEMSSWIVNRLKLGRYDHPLLFMHHFDDIGKYADGDWVYILSKILSHAALTVNIEFLIKRSVRACTFLTTPPGAKLIFQHYPVHRWLFDVYERHKYLSPQGLLTYTPIVKVITTYQVPTHKCMELIMKF